MLPFYKIKQDKPSIFKIFAGPMQWALAFIIKYTATLQKKWLKNPAYPKVLAIFHLKKY
tara:strand:+ start:813 stop:989 length:177 start_codon:yes stop_codon:yes gene_type:complete